MKGSFFRPLSATVRSTAAVCIMLLLPAPGSIAFGFAREGTCDNNPFPDTNPGPGSLKRLRPIDPPQLGEYVKDRQAAIVLGKALFWDMQVGSDGIQSCATCHFRAGADPRSKGQLAFGGGNNKREIVDLGVNYQLKADDFPLHKLSDPSDRKSKVLRTTDDVVSSAGVKKTKFHGATRGASKDNTSPLIDSVYNVGGVNTRRSEPRNTPTVINTAFKRRQFWDGRADEIFNGVDPFGVRNPDAHVLKATSIMKLEPVKVRMTFAAAASQAVGPPLSELEMGSIGRTFKDVGKRLVWATPLAQQIVAADDSVLGPYSKSKAMGSPQKGLTVTYAELIAKAFRPEWWLSAQVAEFSKDGSYRLKPLNLPLDDNEFTQAEFNFSLFFGLAIQLYEMTLISDDAPIDRFFEGNRTALTKQQIDGLALAEEHACVACHSGAEFFNSSARIIYGADGEPGEIIERMPNGNCEVVIYDQSFYNIGVRPWEEDLGIGVNDPFGNPLAISKLLTMPPSQVPSQGTVHHPVSERRQPGPEIKRANFDDR